MDELEQLLAMASGTEYVGDSDDDDLEDMLSDIVSGSEMISGDTEFVGRARRGNSMSRISKAAKMAKLAALIRGGRAAKIEREGVSTIRAYGDKARRLFAGGNTRIISGTSGSVTIRVQESIRPDRVILIAGQQIAAPGAPAVFALLPNENVQIVDIKHGTRSQFSTTSPISAAMLTRDFFSNGGDLGLDTIQAGTDLTLFFNAPFTTLPVSADNFLQVQVDLQGRAMR